MENVGLLGQQPLRCQLRTPRKRRANCRAMQKRQYSPIVICCLVSILGYGLLTASSALAQNGALEGGLSDPFDTLDSTAPAYEPSVFEPFNEKMFSFNIWMDEHVLRPVARSYSGAVPEKARRGVRRFFHNIGVVPRFTNSLLQLKLNGAAREAGRFVINTTIGGLGFFDIAKEKFGLERSEEDFGQTLGKYGVGPGPYLVLPLIGPSTVRDAIGRVADGAMDPKPYFLSPTEVAAVNTGITVTNAVNERSLNLELFESVDRFSLDLYSAVQDFYLQNRERQIAD